ncbi:MAG: hypothetical protein R2839_03760 [Thermomicrobiales bacterium]
MRNSTVTLDGEIVGGCRRHSKRLSVTCARVTATPTGISSNGARVVTIATAVVCPGCDMRFLIDDDDLIELKRWTAAQGFAFGCGVALAGD